MSAIVFLGPTLSADEARAVLDADYRPPAGFGDVIRAASEGPVALGIIDGYFEGQPAVWHKEILWAMAKGIHVFGAASIGALRAAELEPFGMVGVGRIFDDYRSGVLEDDDEVAVTHGPAETGFLKINEPMVNVRVTLARAVDRGIVEADEAREIAQAAKSIFYKKRTYPAVLDAAVARGLAAASLKRLEQWLPEGQIDQKRLDALALLQAISTHLENGTDAMRVSYRLAQTAFWHDARSIALNEEETGGGDRLPRQDLVDELCLDPASFRLAQKAALGRVLALHEAERQGIPDVMDEQAEVLAGLRCREGLRDARDIRAWMDGNAIGDEDFRSLIEDEARIGLLRKAVGQGADRELEAVIVDSGLYPSLARRAVDKQDRLGPHNDGPAALAACGLDDEALLGWFVKERLGRPQFGGFRAYANALGFADDARFRYALAREYCYLNPPGST